MLSLGSVTICIVATIILVLYINIILKRQTVFFGGIKLVFVGIAIILIRLLVPINFPYTITIPVEKIMPEIQDILMKEPLKGVRVSYILLSIWQVGAVIFILVRIVRWGQTKRILEQLCRGTPKEKKEQIYRFLPYKEAKKIRIAVWPEKEAVPFIAGLRKPTLVLPDADWEDQELSFIIRHEIEHYKNFDLWIKALMELLISLYWWNPFMYLLRREFYLAIEMSDDLKVVGEMCKKDKISYVKCLLNTAKRCQMPAPEHGIPLFYRQNDLQIRTNVILNSDFSKKKKICSTAFHLCLISAIAFVCLTLVPEAYDISKIVEETTFEITSENSHLVKTGDGYDLYIEGIYGGSWKEVPDVFENLEIYESEEIDYEKKN